MTIPIINSIEYLLIVLRIFAMCASVDNCCLLSLTLLPVINTMQISCHLLNPAIMKPIDNRISIILELIKTLIGALFNVAHYNNAYYHQCGAPCG